jgi:hypothetical protein
MSGDTSRRAAALVAVIALMMSSAAAQSKKTRFWNLTLYTVTSLQLSPPGKNQWGRNLSKDDPDGTVDHDERLSLTGVPPGRYDVKVSDRTGRTCIVRGVDIADGAIFTIEEKQLTDCGK